MITTKGTERRLEFLIDCGESGLVLPYFQLSQIGKIEFFRNGQPKAATKHI